MLSASVIVALKGGRLGLKDGWTEMNLFQIARNLTVLDLNIPFLPQHRKAWLVGGAIRDLLLGKQPSDIDIISADNAAEYARELAQNIGRRVVELGTSPCNIFRVVGKRSIYDICELNGPSIEHDLIRRDFTINALAWEIPKRVLIDLSKGRKDLAQKQIRMVSDTVFQKDPIRLIRAFRLAGTLKFQIESNTSITIKKEAHRLKTSAAERIQTELYKILKLPDSAATIKAMDVSGLLQQILPEVTDLKNCGQTQFHNTDAFTHTMVAFSALERILTQFDHLFQIGKGGALNASLIDHPEQLKLALLLHDIGKPEASSIGLNGQVHFYGHAKIGAQMADAIARRLALSASQRKYLTLIIGSHLQPSFLFNDHQRGRLSDRAIIRLFRKVQAFTPDLLVHALADFSGKKKSVQNLALKQQFDQFIKGLLERYFFIYESDQKQPPLLLGRDLIKHFELSPSPLFRTILDAVEERRLTGQLISKADALQWTKSFLDRRRTQHSS